MVNERSTPRTPSASRPRRAGAAAGALLVGVLAATASAAPAHAMDTGRGGESIERYLGVSSTGLSRLQRRSEELIARCMKQEGFEYTPSTEALPSGAIDALTGDRKAFVAKYGYGISTFVEPPKKGAVEPNAAYLAKLSKADKRAYNLALTGIDPDKPGSAEATGGLGGLGGRSCVAKAQRELFGDLTKLIALGTKFEDLQKRLNADPKVVRAVREWSACMKKGGFTYAKEDDVTADLGKRLSKLLGVDGGAFGGVGVFGMGNTADIDLPGLRKLQRDELAVAKVDWDCSTKHLGPRDEVAKALNRDFITQNRGALDALRTALGG